MFNFIYPIQRRDAIALGICGIVEHLIDKIIDPGIKTHGDLTDMNHFGRLSSYDMNSENFQVSA